MTPVSIRRARSSCMIQICRSILLFLSFFGFAGFFFPSLLHRFFNVILSNSTLRITQIHLQWQDFVSSGKLSHKLLLSLHILSLLVLLLLHSILGLPISLQQISLATMMSLLASFTVLDSTSTCIPFLLLKLVMFLHRPLRFLPIVMVCFFGCFSLLPIS